METEGGIHHRVRVDGDAPDGRGNGNSARASGVRRDRRHRRSVRRRDGNGDRRVRGTDDVRRPEPADRRGSGRQGHDRDQLHVDPALRLPGVVHAGGLRHGGDGLHAREERRSHDVDELHGVRHRRDRVLPRRVRHPVRRGGRHHRLGRHAAAHREVLHRYVVLLRHAGARAQRRLRRRGVRVLHVPAGLHGHGGDDRHGRPWPNAGSGARSSSSRSSCRSSSIRCSGCGRGAEAGWPRSGRTWIWATGTSTSPVPAWSMRSVGCVRLAGAMVLGPRIGRYNADGSANPMPGHNIPFAMAGAFILVFGWFGFNPGSTFAATDLRISVVAVNTSWRRRSARSPAWRGVCGRRSSASRTRR